jgi:hypothetical protein
LRALSRNARLRALMGLTLPQFGIFAQGTHAHNFLEFRSAGWRECHGGAALVPAAADAGMYRPVE